MRSALLPETLSLPPNYLSSLLDLVHSRGGHPDQILHLQGLPQSILQQSKITLSLAQLSSVIIASCQQSREPALGLYLGSQLTITTHGLLGVAAMASQNLQEALSLICQYTVLRSPLLALSLQHEHERLYLHLTEIQPLGTIRQFVVETFAVALHAILDFVSDHRYRLLQVEFAYPEPDYRGLYQAFFPCPVYFGQKHHRLLLKQQDLQLTSPWANPQLKQQMSSQCEDELQQWQQQQKISSLVRRMLARTKGRLPSIEQVAAEFAVSSRTLRRRLADEQTSYQQLVDNWRKQMAAFYLRDTSLDVQQIAYLLGYADPANFGRAFRRQYAISPLMFRHCSSTQKNTLC